MRPRLIHRPGEGLRYSCAVAILLAFGLLGQAGCRGSEASGRRQLRIMAASSLVDVFSELEQRFEQAHPDVDVVLSTAGSHTLRIQLEQGAPADVFATAHLAHLEALQQQALVGQSVRFAENRLAIAVSGESLARIGTYEGLTHSQRLVLGSSAAPIGIYTDAFLARADIVLPGFRERVLAQVVSYEPNVRLVLAKVELGEADAAVVYRSDLVGRSVASIPIPDEMNPAVVYAAGVLSSSRQQDLAQSWLDYLLSAEARRCFEDHEFDVDRPGEPAL